MEFLWSMVAMTQFSPTYAANRRYTVATAILKKAHFLAFLTSLFMCMAVATVYCLLYFIWAKYPK